MRTAELQWSSRVQHGRNFSCPGERVVFTCTLNHDTHEWIITQQSDLSSSVVAAVTPGVIMNGGVNSSDALYFFDGFINGSVIVSTATVVVTPSIGTIDVRCQRPIITNNATDVQSVQTVFMGKYCNLAIIMQLKCRACFDTRLYSSTRFKVPVLTYVCNLFYLETCFHPFFIF